MDQMRGGLRRGTAVVSASTVSLRKNTCFETTLVAVATTLVGNIKVTIAVMQASEGIQFDFMSLQQLGVLQSSCIAATLVI